MKAPNQNEPIFGRTDALSRFALSGANFISDNASLIYNPGTRGEARAIERFFVGDDGEKAAVNFAREIAPDILVSDAKVIAEGDLWSVGDAMVTLASRLALCPPDMVLFPLRAGHRIREILEGMLPVHPPFASVEFSEAASIPNDGFYRELIAQQIRRYNQDNAQFKLAVVDVGDSGKGTEKMLQLLREVQATRASKQSWLVEFHVFHEHGRTKNFTQYEDIYGEFLAVVEPYRTYTGTKVLDGWVAAMGLEKVKRKVPGGEIYIPKTMEEVRPAAIIVKSSSGYRALVSKVGKHVGNLAVSQYTTQALGASPGHQRRPRFDLWENSQGR